jgi:DNA-binding GntR family transcriptional regulator
MIEPTTEKHVKYAQAVLTSLNFRTDVRSFLLFRFPADTSYRGGGNMPTGKYQRLASTLEQEISAGVYSGGFPNASKLTQTKKVALNTAKAALAVLEEKGLLRKQGPRYYVTSKALTMTQYMPPAHARFAHGFCKNIGPVLRGRLPKHLTAKIAARGESCVDHMQISGEVSEGTERPLQITHRYYILPLADEVLDRMQNDATYDPMWDPSMVPSELLRSRDEVVARPATAEEQKLLAVPKRTAVTSLIESISDMEENLLMIQEVVFSPSTSLVFEYTFKNRP